jgi:hypothetical protein
MEPPSTTSFADGEENDTTAPDGPAASTVWSAGTVTAGAVVSCTVTVNEFDPVFPWESVAVQVTEVVPNANVEPEGGTHDTDNDDDIVPSTASVAD